MSGNPWRGTRRTNPGGRVTIWSAKDGLNPAFMATPRLDASRKRQQRIDAKLAGLMPPRKRRQ